MCLCVVWVLFVVFVACLLLALLILLVDLFVVLVLLGLVVLGVLLLDGLCGSGHVDLRPVHILYNLSNLGHLQFCTR